MTKNRIGAKAIAQRRQAARKHGAYALERRGETALEPSQRTRLQELKAQLATEPGRISYRLDLAAFLALVVELGGSSIREIAERGGNVWESSPISRLGTYLNTLVRLLDGWPKDESGRIDVTTLISGGKDDEQD